MKHQNKKVAIYLISLIYYAPFLQWMPCTNIGELGNNKISQAKYMKTEAINFLNSWAVNSIFAGNPTLPGNYNLAEIIVLSWLWNLVMKEKQVKSKLLNSKTDTGK